MGVTLMRLNKQEIKFLDDHFNDNYYLLEVENMTIEGQKIFQSIQINFICIGHPWHVCRGGN